MNQEYVDTVRLLLAIAPAVCRATKMPAKCALSGLIIQNRNWIKRRQPQFSQSAYGFLATTLPSSQM
jgi:hypothetical protein